MSERKIHFVDNDGNLICAQEEKIAHIETTIKTIDEKISVQIKKFQEFCFGNGKPGADEMMRKILDFVEEYKSKEKEVIADRKIAEGDRKTLKRMLVTALVAAVLSLTTTIIGGIVMLIIRCQMGAS